MAINKWKIFGYTIITWLGLSILAKGLQSAGSAGSDNAQSIVWSWASLIMGFVSASRLGSNINILWGVIAWFITGFIPGIGIFYFAWCYYRIQRKKSEVTYHWRQSFQGNTRLEAGAHLVNAVNSDIIKFYDLSPEQQSMYADYLEHIRSAQKTGILTQHDADELISDTATTSEEGISGNIFTKDTQQTIMPSAATPETPLPLTYPVDTTQEDEGKELEEQFLKWASNDNDDKGQPTS